jgi:hypothetical protein
MKKIIILIFIFIGLGLFFFLKSDIDTTTIQVNSSDKLNDSINIKNQTKTKTMKIKDLTKSIESNQSQATSEEEFEKMSEYLEEVESNWTNSIENLFMSDPENGETFISIYKDMKNGYEMEREKRYQEFHKKMRDEHGSNYSYSPSVDEEMYNEKLVKAYEKTLSEKIGREMMINYMTLKDKFNKDLESNKKSKNDFFTNIEF